MPRRHVAQPERERERNYSPLRASPNGLDSTPWNAGGAGAKGIGRWGLFEAALSVRCGLLVYSPSPYGVTLQKGSSCGLTLWRRWVTRWLGGQPISCPWTGPESHKTTPCWGRRWMERLSLLMELEYVDELLRLAESSSVSEVVERLRELGDRSELRDRVLPIERELLCERAEIIVIPAQLLRSPQPTWEGDTDAATGAPTRDTQPAKWATYQKPIRVGTSENFSQDARRNVTSDEQLEAAVQQQQARRYSLAAAATLKRSAPTEHTALSLLGWQYLDLQENRSLPVNSMTGRSQDPSFNGFAGVHKSEPFGFRLSPRKIEEDIPLSTCTPSTISIRQNNNNNNNNNNNKINK
eukprot:gene2065-1251_t